LGKALTEQKRLRRLFHHQRLRELRVWEVSKRGMGINTATILTIHSNTIHTTTANTKTVSQVGK
jgi:hypothetical protein|tara:strand:- start:116 stop:307 length:192 start_codon:yes stop_codon:yes gene_type:complete